MQEEQKQTRQVISKLNLFRKRDIEDLESECLSARYDRRPPSPASDRGSRARTVHRFDNSAAGFRMDHHYVDERALSTIPAHRRQVSVNSSNYTRGHNRWNEVLLTWDKPETLGLTADQRELLYTTLTSKLGIAHIKIYSDPGRQPRATLVHIVAEEDHPGWDRQCFQAKKRGKGASRIARIGLPVTWAKDCDPYKIRKTLNEFFAAHEEIQFDGDAEEARQEYSEWHKGAVVVKQRKRQKLQEVAGALNKREKAVHSKDVADELERRYVLNLNRSLMDPGTFARLVRDDSEEHSFQVHKIMPALKALYEAAQMIQKLPPRY